MDAAKCVDWTNNLTDADALLIVDVQRDFLPGGALEVPDAEAVIEPLNRYAAEFARRGLPVIATRAWYPANHCSFRPLGGRWPRHCVAGAHGAEWAKDLRLPACVHIVSKGKQPEADGYSAFDNTDLATLLRARGTRRLIIGGLTTDCSVRATALDALRHGYDVMLLADGMRALNARPGDGARAFGELVRRGASIAISSRAAAA